MDPKDVFGTAIKVQFVFYAIVQGLHEAEPLEVSYFVFLGGACGAAILSGLVLVCEKISAFRAGRSYADLAITASIFVLMLPSAYGVVHAFEELI